MEMFDEAVTKDPPRLLGWFPLEAASRPDSPMPSLQPNSLRNNHTTTITPASCGLPGSPSTLCTCPQWLTPLRRGRSAQPARDSIPPSILASDNHNQDFLS